MPASTAWRACATRHRTAASSLAPAGTRQRRSVTRQMVTARSGTAAAVLERRLAGLPLDEDQREVGEPGAQVYEAQAADGAAHEVVGQECAEGRPGQREVIVLPERGPPRHHDQEQADLHEEDDVEEAADQHHPPACTFVSRSMRLERSLYSPASACSSRQMASARATSPIFSSASASS